MQDVINQGFPHWTGSDALSVFGCASVLAYIAGILRFLVHLHNAKTNTSHGQVQLQPIQSRKGMQMIPHCMSMLRFVHIELLCCMIAVRLFVPVDSGLVVFNSLQVLSLSVLHGFACGNCTSTQWDG